MADLAAAEMWKTVGVIVVALITAWSTVRIRGAAGSSKTPAPGGTITVPTATGPAITVPAADLSPDLARIIATMSATIDHMQTLLAEQARSIGKLQTETSLLRAEVALHVKSLHAWQRWYAVLTRDWTTLRLDPEAPAPPETP